VALGGRGQVRHAGRLIIVTVAFYLDAITVDGAGGRAPTIPPQASVASAAKDLCTKCRFSGDRERRPRRERAYVGRALTTSSIAASAGQTEGRVGLKAAWSVRVLGRAPQRSLDRPRHRRSRVSGLCYTVRNWRRASWRLHLEFRPCAAPPFSQHPHHPYERTNRALSRRLQSDRPRSRPLVVLSSFGKCWEESLLASSAYLP